jgi:hypothetical protein
MCLVSVQEMTDTTCLTGGMETDTDIWIVLFLKQEVQGMF